MRVNNIKDNITKYLEFNKDRERDKIMAKIALFVGSVR